VSAHLSYRSVRSLAGVWQVDQQGCDLPRKGRGVSQDGKVEISTRGRGGYNSGWFYLIIKRAYCLVQVNPPLCKIFQCKISDILITSFL